MDHSVEIGVIIAISLLTVAVLSSIFLRKVRFPYTIGLVVIGGLWAFAAQKILILSPMRHLSLSPDLILFLILPTLIFDAAININIQLLYKNLVSILLLACVGIIISTAVIGVSLPLFSTLALGGALLFGALISATDPVAVIALFNEIKAPKRLLTLIDGESIFNDATAIVLFTIILEKQIHSYQDIAANFWPGLLSFFVVLFGGILTGGITGLLSSLMLRIRKGDMILQFTVTLITAYISFILADRLGVSGVISTLTAGLVFTATSDFTIRRRNRDSLHHFWEFFSFIANSFVFLLLGFTEFSIFRTTDSIRHYLWVILLAIPVIVIGRVCVIYILIPFYNRFAGKKQRISKSYQAILLWGGLRGAVPVALVFSIPPSYPGRALILHLTFGFILFTLLFQGTTIKYLMRFLGIEPEKNELEGLKDIVSSTHSFGNEYLTTLVMNSLLDIFSEEGFFISRDEESDNPNAYILKKQDIIFLSSKEGKEISFSNRKEDENYLHTILYETLLEFDKSLREVGAVVKPEELNKLVESSVSADTDISPKREINVLKYISPDHITTDIQSSEKTELIRELLKIPDRKGLIPDHDTALQALLDREETMTTGIGEGIALPHAKIPGISNIIAVIGVKKEGIDYQAMDNKPVHLIVLILSPAADPVPHIQFLAAITKLLSNKERREKIIESSASRIYQIIKEQ